MFKQDPFSSIKLILIEIFWGLCEVDHVSNIFEGNIFGLMIFTFLL